MINKSFFSILFLLISITLQAQNSYDSLVNSGLKLLQEKKIPEAIELYRQALNIDSSRVEVNYGLGVAYSYICQEQKRDCNIAVYYLNKSIKINTLFRNGYFYRGRCKGYLSDFEGALEDFNNAIKKNPKDVDSYFNRALIKIKLGNNKGACEDLFEATNLGSKTAKKLFDLNCGIIENEK